MSASQFSSADPAAGDWQRDFAEAMGGFALVEGTPRAVMRVLGWMVVCQPPEQTAADIQEELELSAGSVSAAVRKLGELGMLEHVTRPGDRRTFHRLRQHGWERALELQFRALGELRRLADSAIKAAAGNGDERLLEMRDTCALMEDGFTSLLRESRWLRTGNAIASTTLLTADG